MGLIKRFPRFTVLFLTILLSAALTPVLEGGLQRPGGQQVAGLTSDNVTAAVILIDSDGTMHVTGTFTFVNTSGIISANVRACPAISTWCTAATFNTSGLWTIQNTSSNTVTSTSTVLTTANFANKSGSSVSCALTDGANKYLAGGSFSIPASSVLSVNLEQGILMNSGIIVSCQTANAVDVGFGGVQAP